jgi:hypothetical protein
MPQIGSFGPEHQSISGSRRARVDFRDGSIAYFAGRPMTSDLHPEADIVTTAQRVSKVLTRMSQQLPSFPRGRRGSTLQKSIKGPDAPLLPAPVMRCVLLKLLQRSADIVEVSAELRTNAVHSSYDGDRDAGGDETVFDSGGTGIVF